MNLLCKLKSEHQLLKGIEDFLKDYEKKDIFLEFNVAHSLYSEPHRLSLFKIEDERLNKFFRLYLKANISEDRRFFFISLFDHLIPLAYQYMKFYIRNRFEVAITKEKEVLVKFQAQIDTFGQGDCLDPGYINITLYNVIFSVSLLKDFIKEIKYNNLSGYFEEDIILIQGHTIRINAVDYLNDFIEELEKSSVKFLALYDHLSGVNTKILFAPNRIKLYEKGFKITFNSHEDILDFIHFIKKDYKSKEEKMHIVVIENEIQQKENLIAHLPFYEFLEYAARRSLRELKLRAGRVRIRVAEDNLRSFFIQKLSRFSNILFNAKIFKKTDFFKTILIKVAESKKEIWQFFEPDDDPCRRHSPYIEYRLASSWRNSVSKFISERFYDLLSKETRERYRKELTFKTKEGQEILIKLISGMPDSRGKVIIFKDGGMRAAMSIPWDRNGGVVWEVFNDIVFDEHKYKDFPLELASMAGIGESEFYFIMKKIKKEFLL